MKTFIALLRGINVGGQKKIKMADLRKALQNIGLESVTTYIQSGNIVFCSNEGDIQKLEESIFDAIKKDFGFEVPTLIISQDEIESMLTSNPFSNQTELNNLYFVLLKQSPSNELMEQFNKLKFENEDFDIETNCVYLSCKKGYGKAKLNNNLVENKLKVQATARNLRTMQKLLELARET
ncbi:DUF1697 domain-containing protein [Flagellimonas nanhaiensis]|uniref:DUF1697 domain-containing protein n=1 Tax=Flagellimonas nanhaiensis TaxID=2292706 RepID=A0A371JPK7_9FLAO|nr:DUF1697 domain-containing protein [Allomuricauda nanhaiensis]RDY59450.1 DUF1697 domain-containing protein [Allomuricauda nanhaiensis]